MNKNKLKDRLIYRIDTIMSKGTSSLILFLGIVTLLIVLLAGAAVLLTDGAWAGQSWPYAVWKSFTLTLDPGNLASVEGTVGLILIASVSTLSGIFITSSLIGIINTGFSNRLEHLQRGNARLIEAGHTVILGFNESVFAIVQELVHANDNSPSACIVLLGDETKQVMEDQILRRISNPKGIRILCRNGDVTSSHDLRRVSIETAKSLIINLSDDYQVIRTILAAANYLSSPQIRAEYPESRKIPIAASIGRPENLQVARIAGQDHAEVLHFNLIIARIMAHVCYQPGLSRVYTDLFNFEGDEIYIEPFAGLAGRSFHDAQLLFEQSTVIGLEQEGKIRLNPAPDTRLSAQDRLVLIARDDRTSIPNKDLPVLPQGMPLVNERYVMEQADDLLILGTNELLPEILKELNEFLPQGSHVTIAASADEALEAADGASGTLGNLVIRRTPMDITQRSNLEQLLELGFRHILILSDRSLPNDQADGKTLTILLQIRDLQRLLERQFSITSEMLDVRNQQLAEVTNVTDFVISSNIAGLIMSQVSEKRELSPIFTELLDSTGCEIYLKPVSYYARLGETLDGYALTHLVSLKQEVLLGYKKTGQEAIRLHSAGIVLNPLKSEPVTFSEGDCLIVLAEN